MALLYIAFFLLTNLTVGYVIWLSFESAAVNSSSDQDLPYIERLFGYLLVGSLINGWLIFVLAELNLFSIGALIVLQLLITAACIWKLVQKGAFKASFRPGQNRDSKLELLAVCVIIVLMSGLFFRPHQFIKGAADAGVYVNLAVHVATEGGFDIQRPALAQLNPDLYPALLRSLPEREFAPYYWQPALYVLDQSGTIIPQFYHLHPAWQAVGYRLAGLEGLLAVTPLWALLGGLAVYVVLRRLAIKWDNYHWLVAAGGLIALSAVSVQSWFARYPTTEPLTQYLYWGGLWAFIVWRDKREQSHFWAAIAAGAWGMTFLARIDTFFLWIAPLALLLWQWRKQQWKSTSWTFLAILTALQIHSIGHALIYSRPYFVNTFRFVLNIIDNYPVLLVAGPIIALIAFAIFWRFTDQMVAFGLKYEKALKGVAIALIIALAYYGWNIRPFIDTERAWSDWYSGNTIVNYDHENLRRLGWYLTPVGVAAAVLGVIQLVWRLDRRSWPLFVNGAIFTLLYLWSVRANPHHIYVMRRYVPIVIPFLIAASALLLDYKQLWRNVLLRYAGLGLTLIWVGLFAWTGQLFIGHIDYQELPQQVSELNAQLDANAIIIFNQTEEIGQGDFLGTPLAFLHQQEVFVLRDREALDIAAFNQNLTDWQAAGYTIYWIELPNGHPWPLTDRPIEQVAQYAINTQELEGSREYRPASTVDINWTGTIYRLP